MKKLEDFDPINIQCKCGYQIKEFNINEWKCFQCGIENKLEDKINEIKSNYVFIDNEYNILKHKTNDVKNAFYIYSHEGICPHIHLRLKDKRDCCIRLDRPEFFDHSGHNRKISNNEIKKELIPFMEKYWKDCRNLWNKNNPNFIIYTNQIPAYNLLK